MKKEAAPQQPTDDHSQADPYVKYYKSDGTPVYRRSAIRQSQQHTIQGESVLPAEVQGHQSYADVILELPPPTERMSFRSQPVNTKVGVAQPLSVHMPRESFTARATPAPEMAPSPKTGRHTAATVARAQAQLTTPAGRAKTKSADAPKKSEETSADVCQVCQGTGYLRVDVPVGHPSFGRAVRCVCKNRQLALQRRNELWKLSNLGAFEEMTFATFNAVLPGVREAFEAAQHFAQSADPPWLVLSGKCGTGKTHLAAAIANERFSQGEIVLFCVVPQLLDHLRSAFAPTSETTYDALFDKILEAGLLILDDLGAEHSTAWAQEKLFQIINHRYMQRMPTVVTTNQALGNLEERIRSRLNDKRMMRIVTLDAPDHRPRNLPPRSAPVQPTPTRMGLRSAH